MGFGALYLLACSGAIVELWRRYRPDGPDAISRRDETFLRGVHTCWVMAGLAWLTVLTGAYVIYPWYRAVPPPGTADLAGFPQRLLLSSPATIDWHSIGMEWKEHVASRLTPISITMALRVVVRTLGRSLRNQPQLRNVVLCFLLASFLAAGIAAFFGAMLNKNAPVAGGSLLSRS